MVRSMKILKCRVPNVRSYNFDLIKFSLFVVVYQSVRFQMIRQLEGKMSQI